MQQPRQRRLDQLAQDRDPAWADAERLINTKLPAHYDAAVTLLRDRQELAQREDQAQAFARRFTARAKRALSGSATRPVPTANSSAGPPRASSASRSTMGPRTDGPNLAA